MCNCVRLGKETGPACAVRAGAGGGLARVGSADETPHAVLAWGSSGTFSLGMLSQA